MNSLLCTLRAAARQWQLAAMALLAASLLPAQNPTTRAPELPAGCEDLRVPAGHVVSFHTYAVGFQVYQWNATTNAWQFLRPEAVLFANAGFHQPIGVHFVGPTWTSVSGSTVVGSFYAGRVVDPTAIPWLRLSVVQAYGPGPFASTTWIQRVNTAGGKAPAYVGQPGETVWVPYTAEYFFYRAL
ncbi:MAG TPA: DUF3455 domain-containing protein [Planctomycetota bacterium]|nr:DUF3455 domain-containing protein [Planctomycetota bacterium]